jgi:prevent-host-death family protein
LINGEIVKNMQTITATWARIHFGEVIRKAVSSGERFVVERDRIPAVVILSMAEYDQLQRQADLSRFYQLSRQAGLEAEAEDLTTAPELQAEIQMVKEQVYAKQYGRD